MLELNEKSSQFAEKGPIAPALWEVADREKILIRLLIEGTDKEPSIVDAEDSKEDAREAIRMIFSNRILLTLLAYPLIP